jgi:RNA-directed DNA polymerase
VSIGDFEERLDDNLYKLWNRMSSGTYFPPPVKAVPIGKPDGGVRWLGVPTVADRVAQAVVAMRGGIDAETFFAGSSYGFRPGRGALDAVGAARENCWRFDWVVDLDIAKFFDTVDHGLLMRCVEWRGWPRWAVIAVGRWIAAPARMPDGEVRARREGTPQGGPVSPLLANLFLHVVFDAWMAREFPDCPFERYADDVIVHARTKRRALGLVAAIGARMAECGLGLHPEKTKVVYCRDANRKGGGWPQTRFVFLGFEFRARVAKGRYGLFDLFSPAIDPAKRKALAAEIRSWRLAKRTGTRIEALAAWVNQRVRGWIAYYGAFAPHEVARVLKYLNSKLFKWMRNKWGITSAKKALARWRRLTAERPHLFHHWQHTVHAHA